MLRTANKRALTDGDDRFRKMISRLRPTQLSNGEVALSENGRMDVDGSWQTREGYKNLGGVTFTTTEVPLLKSSGTASAALILIGSIGGSATDQGGGTLRFTTSGSHGIPTTGALINISGFSGGTGEPNGNRLATWVSTSVFEITVSGVSGSWVSGTIGPFKLSGDQVSLRGACLFSDPDDSNIDYIIVADNAQATAFKVSDLSSTTIAFPSGETLGQVCDLNQEFDVVVLRQKGKTSWYFDPDHASTGFGGTPAFVKFGVGNATADDEETGAATITTDGKVSVAATAHSLSSGDKVTILDNGATPTQLAEGDSYTVTKVDANTFVFYADIDDIGTGDTIVVRTKVSLGGGFINPPGVAWGIYHQGRSWLPYNYSSATTPVHTGIEDEVIASDIHSHVYDPVFSQLRIAGGTADHVVAMHGYDQDRLLVLMRNSIHYLTGVSGSLSDVKRVQLTNRIGCVARKSVVQTPSNQILFLGDKGVYAISFVDELNLRGTDLPLSEAVESIINRITPGSADLAVGIYHDDRYWLALPLDGNDFNSHILIFNFLTNGWESLDRPNLDVTDNAWCIEELIQARSGKVNELYAVTTFGGIHKLDQTGLARDEINGGTGADASYTIPGKLVTRQYSFGSLRRKKFNRMRVQFKSDSDTASQGDLSVSTEDPDHTVAVGAMRDAFSGGLAASEDGTFHARLGNPRGHAAQFTFTVESGRPAVRAIQMDAVESAESTTSFS